MNPLLLVMSVLLSITGVGEMEYAVSRSEVTALVQVENHIWVATFDGGLVELDDKLSVQRMLTPQDGLPSMHVTSLVPDTDGGLWLGTVNGPAHVEKSGSVKVLEKIQGLRMSDCTAFCYAGDNLWITTIEGVRLFDPAYKGKPAWDRLPGNEEFIKPLEEQWGKVPSLVKLDAKTKEPIPTPTWLYLATPPGAVLNDLYSVAHDGDDVWFGGVGKVFRYRPATDVWQTFALPDSDATRFVTALTPYGSDLWVGTDRFLTVLKGMREDNLEFGARFLWSCDVHTLKVYNNRLYAAGSYAVFRYDDPKMRFVPELELPPDATAVSAVLPMEQGWLLGTDNGLWLTQSQGEKTKPVHITLGDTLPRSDVWAVVPGANGAWVATGKGLVFWRNDEPAPEKEVLLGDLGSIRSATHSGDKLWLAGSFGLACKGWNDPLEPIVLPQQCGMTCAVVCDRVGGGVWAAADRRIMQVDDNGNTKSAILLPTAARRVTDMLEIPDYLLVATWGMGVLALDKSSGEILQAFDESYSIGSNLIYCLELVDNRWLLVGTQDAGMDLLDLANGEPLWHLNSSGGLSHTDVLDIMNEPGELWVSIRGVGLNVVDKMDGKVTVFNSRSGPGDVYAREITRVGDYVYVGSGAGCLRIKSPRASAIQNYWEREIPVDTIKPSAKRAAKEVTFAVPGMPETFGASEDNPVKINQ